MRRLFLKPLGAGQKSGQNIPKNRCRTTIAERMMETPAGTALYRGSGRLLKPRTRPPAATLKAAGDSLASEYMVGDRRGNLLLDRLYC